MNIIRSNAGTLAYKGLIVTVSILFLIECINATNIEQITLKKSDQQVIDNFNNSTWVDVIVMLNTKSIDDEKQSRLNSLDYTQKSKIYLEQEEKVISTLSEEEFEPVYRYGIINGIYGKTTIDGLKKLEDNTLVDHVYGISTYYMMLEESLPLVKANYSWGMDYTGKGQTICVLDSGVNYSLDIFYNKVVDGYDYVNLDYFPYDDRGHGTHVASIAAANGSIIGVAPSATLIVYKVLDEDGIGQDQDIIWAIENCVSKRGTYNISSMILSLGTKDTYNSSTCNQSHPLNAAVNNAYDNGILMAISSGNSVSSTGMSRPACASGATSVGAVYDSDIGPKQYCIEPWYWQWWCWIFGPTCEDSTTEADKITCFTNRDSNLDLLAPGSEINASRWCQDSCLDSCSCNGDRMACGGTSMAAPHVGGAAAVLRQINNEITPEFMEYVLKETGKGIYDSVTQETFPRIDLYNASLMVLYSEFFEVSNVGDENLSVSEINSSASWITDVYPRSFTVLPGHNQTVMVTIDLGDEEEVGSYSTNLIIYSNDPDESQKTVKVNYERVHEGCTGDCPPASGDWLVDEYTAIWFEGVDVSGKLILEDTLFLGEQETNITSQINFTGGELRLDGSNFRIK